MEILILPGIIIGIVIIHKTLEWIGLVLSNSQKYNKLKPIFDSLEHKRIQLEKDEIILKEKKENFYQEFTQEKLDLEKILEEKKKQFPWLVDAIADYYAMLDGKKAAHLKYKNHPAMTAAKVVSEVKEEKRILQKQNKYLSYKIKYYESLFPWLSDILEDDTDSEIESNQELRIESNSDTVSHFLTQDEYKKLSVSERNQLALDRYIKNRKSKWEIGRDYEMYVGYLCEQQGFRVEYKGIIDGYEDMGRDVIGKKEGETCIIQCKYWSKQKIIHEKHIFQLFGTTVEYLVSQKNMKKIGNLEELTNFVKKNKVKPIFFTSTLLSEKAKNIATTLGIKIIENHSIGDFPRIKCNIGNNGEKIYHLPFDQQYDRTIIAQEKGERYVFTVAEAEKYGFRRAFKHFS